MAKATVINNINHNGKSYVKGDTFEGDAELVAELIAAGALRDPNTPEDDQEVAAAEWAAAKIRDEAAKELEDAKAEAVKIVEAAKAEADKIISEAKAEAEKASKVETPAPDPKATDAKTNGSAQKPAQKK